MQPKLPSVIDLRIIGACDLRCPFCFGPKHELGPTASKSLLALIPQLPAYGVESLVFAGGEPALVRELPQLLKTAKSFGLKTVLTTNGIRFRERIDELAPYLDWVGLPLDGDSADINQLMRVGNPNHFDVVLDLIPFIRNRYPHLQIKLGTVVCAINKDHIVGIVELIRGVRKPDVWKLYQVVYSSYGEANQSLIEIGDEEYVSVLAEVEKAAAKYSIHIVPYWRSGRSGSYLFLEPTGDALVVSQGREIVIGNFYSAFDEVISSWEKYVDTDELAMNFNKTYPLSIDG